MSENVHSISAYDYPLTEGHIARYPLPERDASKLLAYRNGQIEHLNFRQIVSQLGAKSLLVRNNTKVMPARLHFKRESGAHIEVFCLRPVSPSEQVLAMEAKGEAVWECMIGNKKKFKEGESLKLAQGEPEIKASWADKEKNQVRLEWPEQLTFSECLQQIGELPLPPYLNRKEEEGDRERYQTIFAQREGAVAAPTASLHFTESIFDQIQADGHAIADITLHVGAGTFLPVKEEDLRRHDMHSERISFSKKSIEQLRSCNHIIPIGTTAMRSIESLFWLGCKLLSGEADPLYIEKMYPYEIETVAPDKQTALRAVLDYMRQHNLDELQAETAIMIMPSYNFVLSDALITNFHQPKSTLLVLIAAFIGEDWKKVYREALENDYRFLSYGDSSILFRNRQVGD